ncbi:MAG: hypothetical protein ABI128_15600 [Rhodanobacter sp.]
MSIFKRWSRVRQAQLRMAMARRHVGEPASALLARAHAHPLTALGVAAGGGFALGSLNVHPLRVPGVASLLSGGMAGAIAHGSQWLAELAALGLVGGRPSNADAGVADEVLDAQP